MKKTCKMIKKTKNLTMKQMKEINSQWMLKNKEFNVTKQNH